VGVYRNVQNVALKTKSGALILVDLRVSTSQSNDGEILVTLLAHDPAERTMLERAAIHHHHALSALTNLGSILVDQIANPPSPDEARILLACQQLCLADAIAVYQRTDTLIGYQLHEAINLPVGFPTTVAGIDPAASGQPFNWHAGERPTSVLTRVARNAHYSVLHVRPIGPAANPDILLVLAYEAPPGQSLDTGTFADLVASFFATSHTLQHHLAEHNQRAEQLTALSQLFSIWSASSAEGLLQVDAKDKLVNLNSAAEGLLGFRLADTRGRPLEDVIISAQPIAQPILAAFRNGMHWGGVEVDLVRRDGTTLAAYIRAVPLSAGAGGLILIADRTDQRQFQAQSDHLERRAWLGDLSAIFAHDVRNPLNGIATGLSYLAGKYAPDDPLTDSVNKMQAEVNRIEQLLKNVLIVAKSNEIVYQPVALNQLLERILGRWTTKLARNRITLELDLDPRSPQALADVHQMDQVFTNLIVNASDVMAEKGGTLSVRCHAATDPKTPHGDFVQITFGDTGPGIPPEFLAKIFDPFVTTKSDGTGLGLAITKRIVTAHKGTIFVESFPGIGTAFYVFIPVARRSSGNAYPAP
jgi:signal transduction histidine kinase